MNRFVGCKSDGDTVVVECSNTDGKLSKEGLVLAMLENEWDLSVEDITWDKFCKYYQFDKNIFGQKDFETIDFDEINYVLEEFAYGDLQSGPYYLNGNTFSIKDEWKEITTFEIN